MSKTASGLLIGLYSDENQEICEAAGGEYLMSGSR